jgi:hypothetical protein
MRWLQAHNSLGFLSKAGRAGGKSITSERLIFIKFWEWETVLPFVIFFVSPGGLYWSRLSWLSVKYIFWSSVIVWGNRKRIGSLWLFTVLLSVYGLVAASTCVYWYYIIVIVRVQGCRLTNYTCVNMSGENPEVCVFEQLFSLSSMTPLGNAKKVVLSRCRLLVNMTNGLKLSYYRGNTKTQEIWDSNHIHWV